MRRLACATISLAATLVACKSGAPREASAPKGGRVASCERIGSHVVRFAEGIEDAGADTKARLTSYAGLLELLVSFEQASADLEHDLATVQPDGDAMRRALERVKATLARAHDFAKTEREAVEKHAREVAPLARETQEAWLALRAACAGKKPPAECGSIKDILARYDAAETNAEHRKVIDDLAAAKATSAVAKARDRAVAASRSVHAAIEARTKGAAEMPRKWSTLQKDVEGAMEALAAQCKGTNAPSPSSRFIAADPPDPRKLTVLVKVRPPAKVEQTFAELARAAEDEDEKAFYEARAKGAFGSGFVVVRAAPASEVLVITNRHVVDLGDRAALELADGSQLGTADILYTDAVRDVAILKPTGKVPIDRGFPFATSPAKDQQVVIATGFPGMVGRPSYQTTRGYVSNESFRLEDTPDKTLTYVQHTAPIDPGSSGGPLTDEHGHVLGVNTLKVTNREAVGLAVPSSAILETIRRADAVREHEGSAAHRRAGVRLACLGFIAELAAKEPRMNVLEPMISNVLTGTEGLESAAALEGDETFDRVWQYDSVRAMRIATLVRVRAVILSGGGTSVLETCGDANADDLASIMKNQDVRFRIRLANFDTREMALRWEQGHWKLSAFDFAGRAAPRKRAPAPPKRKK